MVLSSYISIFAAELVVVIEGPIPASANRGGRRRTGGRSGRRFRKAARRPERAPDGSREPPEGGPDWSEPG